MVKQRKPNHIETHPVPRRPSRRCGWRGICGVAAAGAGVAYSHERGTAGGCCHPSHPKL